MSEPSKLPRFLYSGFTDGSAVVRLRRTSQRTPFFIVAAVKPTDLT
jgi:hypothetical protein